MTEAGQLVTVGGHTWWQCANAQGAGPMTDRTPTALMVPEPGVRPCVVAGTIVMAALDRGIDGVWRARHEPTGAFGFGATENAALEMLQTHLEIDRRWYAAHRELPMAGITARIRTAYARMGETG